MINQAINHMNKLKPFFGPLYYPLHAWIVLFCLPDMLSDFGFKISSTICIEYAFKSFGIGNSNETSLIVVGSLPLLLALVGVAAYAIGRTIEKGAAIADAKKDAFRAAWLVVAGYLVWTSAIVYYAETCHEKFCGFVIILPTSFTGLLLGWLSESLNLSYPRGDWFGITAYVLVILINAVILFFVSKWLFKLVDRHFLKKAAKQADAPAA